MAEQPDTPPVLRTERLVLRPLTDDDIEPLLAIVSGPGVGEWWGSADEDALRSDGTAFTIEVDGQTAGWLGVWGEDEPDHRFAGLDISLAPPYQDSGLGPEALRTVIDWLVAERGHHRFTIDPAAHNARAIAAYEKVGFRPVGVMRQYERGPDGTWHDNLLMELLAEDL
jgi:aminoglycoside 6'-N-acetyltransferase